MRSEAPGHAAISSRRERLHAIEWWFVASTFQTSDRADRWTSRQAAVHL